MTVTDSEAFARSETLLGADAMTRLGKVRVLIVGVGGVGGWCAEALVRTGLRHLAIVDDDLVAVSNLNRQCPATVDTLGRRKVEAMRERLLSVNPGAEITAVGERYISGPLPPVGGFPPDVVVDAIDSVDCKAELILAATEAGIPLLSSMGAALRTDPTEIRATRFEKVEGDGLARALRNRFRRIGRFPAAKFTAVWSAERPADCADRGSLMPVTCAFGMVLAAETVKKCLEA